MLRIDCRETRIELGRLVRGTMQEGHETGVGRGGTARTLRVVRFWMFRSQTQQNFLVNQTES